METKQQLEQEIKMLDQAYKNKLIGTDEYCSQLTSLFKRLKKATT